LSTGERADEGPVGLWDNDCEFGGGAAECFGTSHLGVTPLDLVGQIVDQQV
jgi:hypothetical protein